MERVGSARPACVYTRFNNTVTGLNYPTNIRECALGAVFPEAKEQRGWNHRILNVLDKLPLKRQAEARSLLTKIPHAETREEAERQKRAFQVWCTKRGHAEVGRALDRDWERMVTFYAFPREHWKHLRTSNPVESLFAAVRLRTAAAKRFKKVEN